MSIVPSAYFYVKFVNKSFVNSNSLLPITLSAPCIAALKIDLQQHQGEMLTSLPNDWLKRETFNLCLKVSAALACFPLRSSIFQGYEGKEGGRHGWNGVTFHVESALCGDIAREVGDLTEGRSRNRQTLHSSEFNLKPKVKNTFENTTTGDNCIGNPANCIQQKA